jgi:uncharacterized membrane protein YfcA
MDIQLLPLLGAAFLGGLIDSIAGGGGLVVLPVMLLAGMSPKFALGTNKLNSTLGTGVAVWNFYKNGKLLFPLIATGLAFMLFGGFLGAQLALTLSDALLAKVMIGMLPIGIVATLIKKKNSHVNEGLSDSDKWIKTPLICLILGMYDGFFGPGTGSFLALSFYIFLHLNLIQATANAKVFNFLSNLSALASFIVSKKVIFSIGIPMAILGMAGNYIGSSLAIRKGDGLIRWCLSGVLLLLLGTLVWKYRSLL